jgi:hypothetical protein
MTVPSGQNQARDELISFPAVLRLLSLAGELGQRALWRVLLFPPFPHDDSFETNQTVNKKKQVICLSNCSWMQTRTRRNCPSRKNSLHQPSSTHTTSRLGLEGWEGGSKARKSIRAEGQTGKGPRATRELRFIIVQMTLPGRWTQAYKGSNVPGEGCGTVRDPYTLGG